MVKIHGTDGIEMVKNFLPDKFIEDYYKDSDGFPTGESLSIKDVFIEVFNRCSDDEQYALVTALYEAGQIAIWRDKNEQQQQEVDFV